MASNPSPRGSTSRSSTYNDALSLDIQVLALLLQRNHHQQHRCIYYRRLSMVLLALRRASLDWLLIDEFERLSRQVCIQQQADDNVDTSSRKRRLKEEQWTIQRDVEHDIIKIIDDDTNNSSSASDDDDMHTIQLINILQTIRNLTNKLLPELSSRIIHATSPILHELSRGYFVPFLTVALACLGRIHVLVLRLGRELVGTLSQHVPKLRECVAGGSKRKGTGGGLVRLEEALSTLVSVQKRIEGSEPSNEWNDLMKPFTEISHDEFTKKMSNFVRDRRWKDAVAAFGIKADELNEMQILSRQSSDVQGINDVDGKSVNMNIDDMGELVYMQQENNDEKDTTKSGVDDNMARVLDKRRLDETSTSAKKKKRRRKKKKSTDDQAVSEDAVDNTMHIADEDAKAESKQSADDIKNLAEESAKAASKQSDEGLGSSDAPLQNPNLSSKESGNGSDEAAMLDVQESEVEPVAKKEKKPKKKKTKKKKSKNVIDDIFG